MTHILAAGTNTGTNTDFVTTETVYWILAIGSVGAAFGMILVRRAVHCALMLAVVMLCLATMYAMQGAPFLAFVQIIVYTGAVLMLFLFVLMLIGISSSDSIVETIKGQRMAAILLATGLVVLLILGIGHAAIGPATLSKANGGTNNLPGIATLIFTTYVFPFEVTGALLITAAIGAMVLAHRERTTPRPTQRELAARRVASWRRTRRPASTRCTTPPTARPCCRTARPPICRSVRRCRRVTRATNHDSFRLMRLCRSRRKPAAGSPTP
jgi:NADH-quinone oxidoreductase subunit J